MKPLCSEQKSSDFEYQDKRSSFRFMLSSHWNQQQLKISLLVLQQGCLERKFAKQGNIWLGQQPGTHELGFDTLLHVASCVTLYTQGIWDHGSDLGCASFACCLVCAHYLVSFPSFTCCQYLSPYFFAHIFVCLQITNPSKAAESLYFPLTLDE